MIDLHLIVEKTAYVREALARKNCHVDLDELVSLINKRLEALQAGERLKAERNTVQKAITDRKRQGESIDSLLDDLSALKQEIARQDDAFKQLDLTITDFALQLPNLPADDVVGGGKENNVVVSTWSSKPAFDFTPKDHVTLTESLRLIDYERGAKIAGRGMWVYTNQGAILEWALLNYFVQTHLRDGYTFLLPPHILNGESGVAAGQFPKFKDDVFSVETATDDKDRFLLPTAETALVNFHRGELLAEQDLPARYFAYTPCYRKEAGSYRTEERGMIRGHQFNKVELFQFTRPEDSEAALTEMIGKAEQLVQGLGLHYQVSKLAAEDCSAAMRKTYDVEVWIPSMGIYKEVSSASNAGDYQARRGKIRFKDRDGKNRFVHTLNASGLATSRILPAMLEQHQNHDGSVTIPEALRPFTGFDIIRPR